MNRIHNKTEANTSSVSCPSCGHISFSLIREAIPVFHIIVEDFPLVRCDSCGKDFVSVDEVISFEKAFSKLQPCNITYKEAVRLRDVLKKEGEVHGEGI